MTRLALLLLASTFAAAQEPVLFDRAKTPVGDSDFILLTEKGYRFPPDGGLAAPNGAKVTESDYFYVIEELRSAKRLEALMRINLVLSRNNFSSSLPKADAAEIKEVARRNWHLLSKETRDQVAPYLGAKELFELNEKLKPAPIIPAGRGAPLKALGAAPAVPPAVRPLPPAPTERSPEPERTPASSEEPPGLPSDEELAEAVGGNRPPPAAAETARPAFTVEQAAPPPVATTEAGSELSRQALSSPPEPEPAPPEAKPSPPEEPAAAAAAAPAPPAAAPTTPEEAYPDYQPQRFALFLKASPYDARIRDLLSLIERHTEEDDRRAALGTLMLRLPRIRIGGPEVADERRFSLTYPEGPEGRPLLVLREAVGISESKRFLSGIERSYASPEEAGSAAFAFDETQLAGVLLRALLTLDGERRGLDRKSAANRIRALAAEHAFYDSFTRASETPPRLDPDAAILHEAWTARPEDFYDFLAQLPDGGPAVEARKETEFYEPSVRAFNADVPAGWRAEEAETPRSVVVRLFGPTEAEGAWRAAYHIHFFDKGRPGYQDARDFFKALQAESKLSDRVLTRPKSLRVSRKAARIFESREKRLLPFGALPSRTVTLHAYYALVPHGRDEYALIKLVTTEKTYLDYRKEFQRFLRTFRITGL